MISPHKHSDKYADNQSRAGRYQELRSGQLRVRPRESPPSAARTGRARPRYLRRFPGRSSTSCLIRKRTSCAGARRKAPCASPFVSAIDGREYTVYRDTSTGYYVYDPVTKFKLVEQKQQVGSWMKQHLGVDASTDLKSSSPRPSACLKAPSPWTLPTSLPKGR